MSDLSIFISCGQYTSSEKALGKAIVQMVDGIPGMKAYFAEEVQDLNGLQANILSKLQRCDGFITVMHPRGDIERPEGSTHTRASVWIEQEIAIATYIRQVEKRDLPVIAFKHRSVGMEGIRSLIQLNPTEFSDDTEVLVALPGRLAAWKTLNPSGIHPDIKSTKVIRRESDHEIRQLHFWIVNDSGHRLSQFNGELRVPNRILSHWSASYGLRNQRSQDGKLRLFQFDESDGGAIKPRSTHQVGTIDYCRQCAMENVAEGPMAFIDAIEVDDYEVGMTVWVDGRESQTEKTLKQLLFAASKT